MLQAPFTPGTSSRHSLIFFQLNQHKQETPSTNIVFFHVLVPLWPDSQPQTRELDGTTIFTVALQEIHVTKLRLSRQRSFVTGFLLTGGVSLEDPPARPAEWVPDRCWGELFRLAKSKEGLDGEGFDVKRWFDTWKIHTRRCWMIWWCGWDLGIYWIYF